RSRTLRVERLSMSFWPKLAARCSSHRTAPYFSSSSADAIADQPSSPTRRSPDLAADADGEVGDEAMPEPAHLRLRSGLHAAPGVGDGGDAVNDGGITAVGHAAPGRAEEDTVELLLTCDLVLCLLV